MREHNISELRECGFVNHNCVIHVAASYVLMAWHIVGLVQVLATQAENIDKMLGRVYLQPWCRGKLLLALAAYTVAQHAASFVNLEMGLACSPVLAGSESTRQGQHLYLVFFSRPTE